MDLIRSEIIYGVLRAIKYLVAHTKTSRTLVLNYKAPSSPGAEGSPVCNFMFPNFDSW